MFDEVEAGALRDRQQQIRGLHPAQATEVGGQHVVPHQIGVGEQERDEVVRDHHYRVGTFLAHRGNKFTIELSFHR